MNKVEMECRICREGEEEDRPLRCPCVCSGSIMFCHQDCLEAWLKHSGKDTCELCGTRYEFSPQYSEDMPTVIPIHQIVTSLIKKLCYDAFPSLVRIIVVGVVWLFVVPLAATWVYRWIIRKEDFSTAHIFADAISGIVIAGTIVLFFIVAMSFVEFLRTFWNAAHLPPAARAGGVQGGGGIPGGGIPGHLPGVDAPAGGGDFRLPIARQQEQPARPPHVEEAVLGQGAGVIPPIDQGADDPPNFIFDGDTNSSSSSSCDSSYTADLDQYTVLTSDTFDEEDRLSDEELDVPEELENFFDVPEHNLRPVVQPSGAVDSSSEDGNIDNSSDSDADVEDDIDIDAVDALEDHAEALHDQLENMILDAEEEAEAAQLAADVADLGEAGVLDVGAVLGMRGPILAVLQTAALFTAFNWIVLMMTGFPFAMGISLTNLLMRLSAKVTHSISTSDHWACIYVLAPLVTFVYDTKIVQSWVNLVHQLDIHESMSIVHISDGWFVFSGLVGIILFLLTVGAFAHLVELVGIKGAIVDKVKVVSNVTKAGTFLAVRILVLPVILGGVLVYVLNEEILHYSAATLADFAVKYVAGFVAIVWMVGIIFMLAVTLSILQLREVLHPDILSHYIRSQEVQSELLASLMNDNGFTQVRRIVSSFGVYFLLLGLFVYLPISLVNTLFFCVSEVIPGMSSMQFQVDQPSIAIYAYYFCTEVQLPLEVVMGHLSLLAVLEKRKNWIGKLQHSIILKLSTLVGLNRMLLPYPMIMQESGKVMLMEDGTTPVVGEAIRRPPPGWDSRTNADVGRWSWGPDAAPSAIQATVAPRLVPTYWWLRIPCFFVLLWFATVAIGAFCIIAPIVSGRIISTPLQVIFQYSHDPLSFAFGILAVSHFISFLLTYVKKSWRRKFLVYFRAHGSWIHVSQAVYDMLLCALSMGSMMAAVSMTSTWNLTDVDKWTTASGVVTEFTNHVCRHIICGLILFAIAGCLLYSKRYEPLLKLMMKDEYIPSIDEFYASMRDSFVAINRYDYRTVNAGVNQYLNVLKQLRKVVVSSWLTFFSLVLFVQVVIYCMLCVCCNGKDAAPISIDTDGSGLAFACSITEVSLMVFLCVAYRVSVFVWLVYWSTFVTAPLATQGGKFLYKTVRDDKYLLGRSLQNASMHKEMDKKID